MKLHTILTFFLLFSLAAATPSSAQFWNNWFGGGSNVKQGALDIEMVDESYDFGVVRKDNYPGYEFRFTNNSDETVQIKEFRGCNLTVPAYTKEDIEPGEEGYFKIILNPRDVSGSFRKKMQVVFQYDEEGEQQLTYEEVRIKGKVIRGLGSR